MEESKNKLWMRVGCVFWVTPEEADILLSCSSDMDERTDLLRRLMLDGHFAAGGETYIPGKCVTDYNEAYGTEFPSDDIEFEL